MNIRYIITCLTMAIVALTANAKPNLLLIVADDMGYGDLSCYGSKQIPTPNLDALAANGVRCTDGYVSASVCAPSRAGLLTGRYQNRFGFEHNLRPYASVKPEFQGIPVSQPLISNKLKALGYETGIIGKWHLGETIEGFHPNKRGFDYFFGMLGGGHDYWPTLKKNQLTLNGEKITSIRTPYLTDWFTLEANDYITRHSENDKPWFLYLSYNTPHAPMQAKKEDLEKFAHIKNKTRRTYCAMQHNMDTNIGTIIDNLKKLNQLDNTLIVFISDNGGSVEVSHAVNAPYRGGKGSNLEGGLRVPTIYHWPSKLPKGTVYDKPIISLDILPTFIAASGAEPPKTQPLGTSVKNPKQATTDGVNLLPYLSGDNKEDPHSHLFWRMTLRAKSVRAGDWKLLIPAHNQPALYNLKEDPSELNNLYSEKTDIVSNLRESIINWEASLESNPTWISGPNWYSYNKNLYDRKFILRQPEKDDPTNYWGFKSLNEHVQ